MLSGIAWCGCCQARLYVSGSASNSEYLCTGRVRGRVASAQCRPAPSIGIAALDAQVAAWFVSTYGVGEVMKRVWDPGTGHAAQAADLTAARDRLKADRDAGLYDDEDEAQWYRARYRALTDEIKAVRALPERKPGMIEIGTGRTLGQEWQAAGTARRREMLAEFSVRVVINAKKAPAGATRPATATRPQRVTITGTETPAARLVEDEGSLGSPGPRTTASKTRRQRGLRAGTKVPPDRRASPRPPPPSGYAGPARTPRAESQRQRNKGATRSFPDRGKPPKAAISPRTPLPPP